MEVRLDKLDKNLAVETNAEGFVFYDVRKAPFAIYGLHNPQEQGVFMRMPKQAAERVSEAVGIMNQYPAGGRIRFKTNATHIAVRGNMPNWHTGANSSQYSRSGFDFHAREDGKYVYLGAICPPMEFKGGSFCAVAELNKTRSDMRDVTMYLPIANSIDVLEIGVPEGCIVEAGDMYTCPLKPVVYYGSSITMGMGAGRPSAIYQGIVCRKLDWDFLNLGFSGNALAEKAIQEYVADLDMSVFVLDYDHNSPNPTHLKETQMEFYKTVRAKQPELPIIMMSRPVPDLAQGDDKARFDALWDNYKTAVAQGDKNLYFIKGYELFLPDAAQDSLADGCHPNDLGYYGMGVTVEKLLREIMEKLLDKK